MQQTFKLETDSLFLSISGVKETMIFTEADWDWWIKKKFSWQLTGKHRVQGMLNVTSSSSQMLSSTSKTMSWKAWLINEITPHLQKLNFVRKTNQGTPQHFCEKMQHWYLKIFTRTINTLPTTRWRDVRIIREIIFTTSSELTSETLWIIIHQWKIQVSLKSRLSPKYARTVFLKSKMISRLTWNQSWFQGWLEIKVDFKVDLKSRIKFHELPWRSRLYSFLTI